MKLVADRIEVLAAVKWYFESKNLSLRSALSFQAPLSASGITDMRTYYSQYFVSLGSVTELLLEKEREGWDRFRELLYSHLGNELKQANGENIYLYIKELRNAIVHRGLDISAAAHFLTNAPLLLLPDKLADRWKKREHAAPTKYVAQLIKVCECAIGPAVETHLCNLGLFKDDVEVEELRMNYLSSVQASSAMPENVRTVALGEVHSIDHLMVYGQFLEAVRNVLHPQPVPLTLPA